MKIVAESNDVAAVDATADGCYWSRFPGGASATAAVAAALAKRENDQKH